MEKPNYREFWRRVTNDGKRPCALSGTPCHRCDGSGQLPPSVGREGGSCGRCRGSGILPCSGQIDAHHFVPKRRLRTSAAKTDVRNGVALCRAHHELVEQGFADAPRPLELVFFLHDHDVSDRSVPR